jgi:hypothetical protein
MADEGRWRRKAALLDRFTDAFCRSPLRIGSLAEPLQVPLICKGMAEALRDNKNRSKWGRIPSGMRFCEMHPAKSASSATRNHPKRAVRIPILYVPLRSFGCL